MVNLIVAAATLCLMCAASAATTQSHASNGGVPIANVQVSQWTVDMLYSRYFADELKDQLLTTATNTVAEWRRDFNVHLWDPCHKRDFATTVEYEGFVTTPEGSFDTVDPHVSILPNGNVGLFGSFSGRYESKATAWFIETICFSNECLCKGVPRFNLCTASAITQAFLVNYSIQVSLVPDASGFLPLPTTAVWSDVPLTYANRCPAEHPNRTDPYPEFVDKFNRTFMADTLGNFSMLGPRLSATVSGVLVDFARDSLRPALRRYFPASVATRGGLTTQYMVTAAATDTTMPSTGSPGTADPHGFIQWNVSAAFLVDAVDGTKRTFVPSAALRRASSALRMPSSSGLGPASDVVATRITLSSVLLQVAAWYASARDALSRKVNNTILDATIAIDVNLDTPASAVRHAAPVLPTISASMPDDDVGDAVLSQVPRSLADRVEHQLFMTIAAGTVSMTCKHGNMTLVDADMFNVTTHTDAALTLDIASDVLSTPATLDPMHVPSLFLWTSDFDRFRDARFHVTKPTGGFPKETLVSMIEKALNESLPHVNAAYRRHRLPLPHAAALLLRPASGMPPQLPNASLYRVRRRGGAASSAVAAQGQLQLFAMKPKVAPPPRPPPPLPDAVPIVVAIDHRENCSVTLSAAMAVVNADVFAGRLSTECVLLATVNASQTPLYGRMREFTKTTVDFGDGRPAVRDFPRPTVVDLACTQPDCTRCLLPAARLPYDGATVSACFPVPAINGSGAGSISGTMTLSLVSPSANVNASDRAPIVPAPCFVAHSPLIRSSDVALSRTEECGPDDDQYEQHRRRTVFMRQPPDAVPNHSSAAFAPTCALLPGSSYTAVLSGDGALNVPCFRCPRHPYEILAACPLNTSMNVHRIASGAECFRTNVTDTIVWIGEPTMLPQCQLLRFLTPPPPVTPFDFALWIPVILVLAFAVVVSAVAVWKLALPWWFRRQLVQSRASQSDDAPAGAATATPVAAGHDDDDEPNVDIVATPRDTASSASSSSASASMRQEADADDHVRPAVSTDTLDEAGTSTAAAGGLNFSTVGRAAGGHDGVDAAVPTGPTDPLLASPRLVVSPFVLPDGTAFASVFAGLVVLVCGIAAIVFAASPPFARFSTASVRTRGMPSNFDMGGLESAVALWTQVMIGFFAAVAAVVATCCAVLAVLTSIVRKRPLKRLRRITGRMLQCSPRVIAIVALLAALGSQVAVLMPPLHFDAQSMASMSFNASDQSLVSVQELDRTGSTVASVASTLSLLPAVLQFVVTFASAVPVASCAGVAIRACIVLYRWRATGLTFRAAIRRLLRADAPSSETAAAADGDDAATASVDRDPWKRQETLLHPYYTDDTAASAAYGYSFAGAVDLHGYNDDDDDTDGDGGNYAPATMWPRRTDSFAAAMPPAWAMVQTLCSASVFCMTTVLAFIAYQSTRDAVDLSFSVVRSLSGLVLPIWSVQCLSRVGKARDMRVRVELLRQGLAVAIVAVLADLVASVVVCADSDDIGGGASFALHTAIGVCFTWFFAHLDLAPRSGGRSGSGAPSRWGGSTRGGLESFRSGGGGWKGADDDESVSAIATESTTTGIVRASNASLNARASSVAVATRRPVLRADQRPAAAAAAAKGGRIASCVGALTNAATAAERFSKPWWRVPFLVVATVFVILAFAANVQSVHDNRLRPELISYLESNGIQFPSNMSHVHLFVDPGIDAYVTSLRHDLVPMGIGLATTIAALGIALVAPFLPQPLATYGAVATRVLAITSYAVLIITAVYFTLPDFVRDSHLDDVVPDCAPRFFREGELLLHTVARAFFSSVVFGRLVPLLVTFPPAVVRVQCFVADQCGVGAHAGPMLVATLVTNLSVQLPLLTVALAAHSNAVVGLAATLPIALLCVVPVFRERFWRHTILAPTPVLWLVASLGVWWVVYFGGWIALVWQAIETDHRLWGVARRLFTSPSLWYEIFANFFLATVAFCDVVWLTTQGTSVEGGFPAHEMADSDDNDDAAATATVRTDSVLAIPHAGRAGDGDAVYTPLSDDDAEDDTAKTNTATPGRRACNKSE